VDSGYFKTIGQSLLEGVYFSPADFADGRRVAIVNDVVAQKLAPNGSALGPSTVDDGPPVMIVGVVKGIKNPGESSVAMRYYYPLHPGETKLLIKLHDNQSLSRHQVGKLLREIGSQWSVWKFESLQENANKRLFAQTTTAVTTAVLTVITFFLAGVGLYGVLSYSTQMRRFEIGARLAIGAKRRDIIRLIVGDNARSISVGVVVGVVVLFLLAYGFSQQLESYFDWQLLINLGGTLFLIGLISFFACYAPLRRYIDKPVVNSLRGSE
jgi:ABC-type antimicrobial peptide transport system permease subunit